MMHFREMKLWLTRLMQKGHQRKCIAIIALIFVFVYVAIQRYTMLRNRDVLNMSALHTSLFDKNEEHGGADFDNISRLVDIPMNFNFTHKEYLPDKIILWFNPPPWIVRRNKVEFMLTCEYNNCLLSEDKHDVERANAVIFAIAGAGMGSKPPLARAQRNPNQAWVFYTLEPPMNLRQNDFRSPFWLRTMNWSMTYRFDSDVLAPYGTFRTRKDIPKRDYKTVFRRKTGMVAWVVSHCDAESGRDEYVHDLRRHGVDVDIYGACGNRGQISENAIEQLNNYKFFISFENALCTDYISCKVFKKFNLDLILIVRGGADYTRLMPPGTYINTDDFPTTADLAAFILKLSWNFVLYTRILSQKERYEVLNEDEFGYPYAMCDLCRRLNALDKYRKQYDDMRDFLEAPQCRAPKDVNVTKKRTYSPKHVYLES